MTTRATNGEARPLLEPTTVHGQESIVVVHEEHHHQHGDEHGSRDQSAPKTDRLHHHREMVRERFSFNWWFEWFIIIVVFSVTGSSTMLVVRPLMKALGLTGSLGAGPWSFRIAYIVLTLPLYSCMLLLVSSLVCRRPYFEHLLIRMWGRFWPTRLINKCRGNRNHDE